MVVNIHGDGDWLLRCNIVHELVERFFDFSNFDCSMEISKLFKWILFDFLRSMFVEELLKRIAQV